MGPQVDNLTPNETDQTEPLSDEATRSGGRRCGTKARYQILASGGHLASAASGLVVVLAELAFAANTAGWPAKLGGERDLSATQYASLLGDTFRRCAAFERLCFSRAQRAHDNLWKRLRDKHKQGGRIWSWT